MQVSIRSCKPGISLFQLIDEIWLGSTGSDTLHRICTMMRWMWAQSLVVESVDVGFFEFNRIHQEVMAIEKRLGSKVTWEAKKVTFLRQAIDNRDHINAKVATVIKAANDDFLGYVIVVNLVIRDRLKKSFVYESITRDLFPQKATLADATLPAHPPSHYLHVKNKFECRVLQQQKTYTLVGAFFRQQNSITNVCAHACAVMMLNNCKEVSDLVTCEAINDILGIDHEKRRLEINKNYSDNYTGENGVDTRELRANVFSRFGFTATSYSQKDFRAFVYGYVESGYPAWLVFSTSDEHRGNVIPGHIVAAVGHTLDAHSWFPNAYPSYSKAHKRKSFLSSLAWINDFLVHDDNFGMQLSLPAHCFSPEGETDANKSIAPVEAVGIYPLNKKVRLPAHTAERAALLGLKQAFRMFYYGGMTPPKENYYVKHLCDLVFGDPPTVVLRTSLVERSAYLKHLERADNLGQRYSGASLKAIAAETAEHPRFWLIEVTEPDLYAGNLSKVVDVLVNPSFDPGARENPNDLRKSLILLRFPEFLLRPKAFTEKDTEYFPPAALGDIAGHMSLICGDCV